MKTLFILILITTTLSLFADELKYSIKEDIKVSKYIPIPKEKKTMILGYGVGKIHNKDFYTKLNLTAYSLDLQGKNSLIFNKFIFIDTAIGMKPNTGKIFLDKIDLIKIKKLQISQEENLISWKINLGSKAIEYNNKDKYNNFFKGSIGKAYQINEYVTSSFMVDASIQTIYPDIEAMGNIGLDFNFDKLKSSSIFGLKVNPYNSSKTEFIEITSEYKVNSNFLISACLDKDISKKYTLDFKWFF